MSDTEITFYPRLFGKYQALARLNDRNQRRGVIAARRMGEHIVEIRTDQRRAEYGDHAIERLARVLGKSPKTLYRYPCGSLISFPTSIRTFIQ